MTFNISGVGHHVGINNITSNSVSIEVASTPQNATLVIGETKKFEVTGDNYYDLSVTLNKINGSNADLIIKLINESIPGSITQPNVSNTQTNVSDIEDETVSVPSNRSLIMGLVVIVLVVILGVWLFLRFRNKDKKIERAIRYSSKRY